MWKEATKVYFQYYYYWTSNKKINQLHGFLFHYPAPNRTGGRAWLWLTAPRHSNAFTPPQPCISHHTSTFTHKPGKRSPNKLRNGRREGNFGLRDGSFQMLPFECLGSVRRSNVCAWQVSDGLGSEVNTEHAYRYKMNKIIM